MLLPALVLEKQLVCVSAHEIQAVDTTGAGDAYLGELAAHLAFGGSIVDGMRYNTRRRHSWCSLLAPGKWTHRELAMLLGSV